MQDVIIIGAGPAGLTASIYLSCFKVSNTVIGSVVGGQMSLAPDIINYPGFEEVSGMELTKRMASQAEKRGGTILKATVNAIVKENELFTVECDTREKLQSPLIILATGVERSKLNVPGENAYIGKGVQYCASCEYFDYQNKVVAVVGGANAAAQTATQLAHAAAKVFVLNRSDVLRADPVWLTQINENPIIEVRYNTSVKEILGDGKELTGVKLLTATPGSGTPIENVLQIERLYIEIGGVPGTVLLSPLGVQLDERGHIAVSESLETTVKGIFAAGDVISHKYSIEQISSAVGLGARAATAAFSRFKDQIAPSLWGSSQINRSVQKQ
ncbi:MAG: FAD-dependent oxidoreductase [bacterium]|nr:FAD-dependent oxidoreductase [bacterium]